MMFPKSIAWQKEILRKYVRGDILTRISILYYVGINRKLYILKLL